MTETTPREQLSQLFGSYKAEWLKEQVFELFTEPALPLTFRLYVNAYINELM